MFRTASINDRDYIATGQIFCASKTSDLKTPTYHAEQNLIGARRTELASLEHLLDVVAPNTHEVARAARPVLVEPVQYLRCQFSSELLLSKQMCEGITGHTHRTDSTSSWKCWKWVICWKTTIGRRLHDVYSVQELKNVLTASILFSCAWATVTSA